MIREVLKLVFITIWLLALFYFIYALIVIFFINLFALTIQ